MSRLSAYLIYVHYVVIMFRKLSHEITFNGRIRCYPSQLIIDVAEQKNYQQDGWETQLKQVKEHSAKSASDWSGVYRARRRLKDIALLNEFTYFATLTIDGKKCDRYDVDVIYHKLRNWLSNNVRRHGLKYVLVPELHKDGAVHFHGLFDTGDMPLTDSGHRWKEMVVWHLDSWVKSWGFCTLVALDGEYGKVCSYVTKYITKGTDKVLGGRYYLSCQGLKREPPCVYMEVEHNGIGQIEGAYDGYGCKAVSMTVRREQLEPLLTFSSLLTLNEHVFKLTVDGKFLVDGVVVYEDTSNLSGGSTPHLGEFGCASSGDSMGVGRDGLKSGGLASTETRGLSSL